MKIFLCLALSVAAWAQAATPTEEDRAAVRRAALDYVEAIYQAQPERLDRSVHPELSKHGFWFNDQEARWQEAKMPFARLKAIAATFNAAKKDSSRWPKEITVFEVMSHTANVKLVADWGVDYLQLIKTGGEWKILHIVWQSLPAPSKSTR